jgi:type II secretory pathway component GspD/PulD (secretin)
MGMLGSSGGSASVSGRKSIKDLIEEAVPSPPGAKIVFDDKTGALIVTNTPTNLQKIEEIIYTVDEPPQQISIESRFIEVSMDEIENFGINTNVDSRIVHDSENNIGTTISNIFTGIASTPASDTGGLAMNLTGLLTDPQFSMVLNALQRLDKTKTLSAPKITTVNNQTATIKVVTEEVFRHGSKYP